jgi:hypothetical protein
MKRNILIFIFLILIATSFKYRSKTQAGILDPDSRVIIEQTTTMQNDPAIRTKIETDEIRSLENLEMKAVTEGDTARLFQLWSSKLVVTNPDNSIKDFSAMKKDLMENKPLENPFNRVIENITLNGNVAVVMGYETPVVNSPKKTEEIISRRYTNIWMKDGNAWKLTARQASNTLTVK